MSPEHNAYKSDIYSLGMVLLYAGLFESMESCYDYEDYQLKESVIDYHLQCLSERYSPNYYELVKGMLSINENSRPSYDELLNYFQTKVNPKLYVESIHPVFFPEKSCK